MSMNTPKIPAEWERILLPSASLSISAFLRFKLPQVSLDNAGLVPDELFSTAEPMSGEALDQDLILTILAILDGARSIRCLHGLTKPIHVPIWLLTFWNRVVGLRDTHLRAWMQVNERLNLMKQRRVDDETKRLVSQASNVLLSMTWDGPILGFLEREPKYKLSLYTTTEWLSDTHENQMLDLLRSQLHGPTPSLPTIPLIKNTDFAKAIHTAWRRYSDLKDSSGYATSRAFQHLHETGTLLSTGAYSHLATIMLVEGNHWVSMVLDFPNSRILYGDPGGSEMPDETTQQMLLWWTNIHTERTFRFEELSITRQIDGFSCGLLAWNALMHFFIPGSAPLFSAKHVALERLRVFVQVAQHHLDQGNDSILESTFYEYSYNPAEVSDTDEDDDVHMVDAPCINPPLASAVVPTKLEVLDPSDGVNPDAVPLKAPNIPLDSPPRKRQKVSVLSTIRQATESSTCGAPKGLLNFFTTCSKEKYESHVKEVFEEHSAKREVLEAQDRIAKEKKAVHVREGNRLRQEKCRERKYEEDIQTGKRSPGGTKRKHIEVELEPEKEDQRNLAELSRPARRILSEEKEKSKKSCGRKRKNQPKQAKYVNWHEPFLWSQIETAARHPSIGYRMSAIAIRNQLILSNPKDFAKISPNTIEGWIDRSKPGRPCWSAKAVKMAEQGSRPSSQGGRTGVLKQHPDVVDTLISLLDNLRKAGAPLSLVTIRGLTVATILTKAPEVFEKRAKDGSVFRCSDSWMRKWLRRAMHWSERRATRTAQKIPSNWEEQCEKSFLRLAHDIKEHDIPSELYVNTDQSQGVYAQGSNFTWAEIGSKQVSTVGADEKRAMTMVVSVSNSGVLLPFQAVYKGESKVSCPKKTKANSAAYENAKSANFKFEFSGNQTYWSTQKTMRSLVNDIIAPYFEEQKAKLGLPTRQKSLWQIDVWSVHRSDEFRGWMRKSHPSIIVHFIPGGCTGLFQACDVGMQRILKQSLRRSCHHDIVQEVLEQFNGGTEADDVKFDRTVGILRDRTVSWLWNAYESLNKPEIVKKAFKMCRVKEWDLSYESLVSFAAREKLRLLKEENDPFWNELNSSKSVAISDAEAMQEDEATHEDYNDDSDLPVSAIISHVVSGELAAGTRISTDTEDPGMKSTSQMEDILFEDESGEAVYTEVEGTTVQRAEGKRVIKAVKKYSGKEFWRH